MGLGVISGQVLRRLSCFDCEIAYTRDAVVTVFVTGYKKLERLIGWADVVSLYLPLTA